MCLEKSSTLERLQNERNALDKMFREHTSLQGLDDFEALRTYLAGVRETATVSNSFFDALGVNLTRTHIP